ncbi:MAG: 1,2-phenylacetyl-CoA epoxidase subunit PaaC [Bacteroidota bacterium]
MTNRIIPYLTSLADDELVLGHRDSEWTGYAPILEEDIAFSNIAQDELGHSLAFYTLAEKLGNSSPDTMAFDRPWQKFFCCRFVQYPKGDFAYTVMRQFLFDSAERVRMKSLGSSTYEPLRDCSSKILAEEAYHLMHTQALIERLGDATEESHNRMQSAAAAAFPQSLGMFEDFEGEDELVKQGIIVPSKDLKAEWLSFVVPLLERASLKLPVRGLEPDCIPDLGGRRGKHTEHLAHVVADLQKVYQMAPGANW